MYTHRAAATLDSLSVFMYVERCKAMPATVYDLVPIFSSLIAGWAYYKNEGLLLCWYWLIIILKKKTITT